MKILVDTHFLLWILFDSEKIKKQEREEFLNLENDIFISVVSLWEISLKVSIGKLQLYNVVPEEIHDLLKKNGFSILNLEHTIASSFHNLPREHKDPFDRLLIWQAINNNMYFLSRDKDVLKYKKHGLMLFK